MVVTSGLEVFKKHVDVVQGIGARTGPGRAGLKAGLNNLYGLFQTSIILWNAEKYPSHLKNFPS